MADNAHFIKTHHVNAFLSTYRTIEAGSPVEVLMPGQQFDIVSSSLLSYERSKWIFLDVTKSHTWPSHSCIPHKDGKYRVLAESMQVIEIPQVNAGLGMKYIESCNPLLELGVEWYLPILER